MYAMDIASTNAGNTMQTNIASTASINYNDKKVRYKIDCYILYTVLLVIILLLIITTICYRSIKHRPKLNILQC